VQVLKHSASDSMYEPPSQDNSHKSLYDQLQLRQQFQPIWYCTVHGSGSSYPTAKLWI